MYVHCIIFKKENTTFKIFLNGLLYRFFSKYERLMNDFYCFINTLDYVTINLLSSLYKILKVHNYNKLSNKFYIT